MNMSVESLREDLRKLQFQILELEQRAAKGDRTVIRRIINLCEQRSCNYKMIGEASLRNLVAKRATLKHSRDT